MSGRWLILLLIAIMALLPSAMIQASAHAPMTSLNHPDKPVCHTNHSLGCTVHFCIDCAVPLVFLLNTIRITEAYPPVSRPRPAGVSTTPATKPPIG